MKIINITTLKLFNSDICNQHDHRGIHDRSKLNGNQDHNRIHGRIRGIRSKHRPQPRARHQRTSCQDPGQIWQCSWWQVRGVQRLQDRDIQRGRQHKDSRIRSRNDRSKHQPQPRHRRTSCHDIRNRWRMRREWKLRAS